MILDKNTAMYSLHLYGGVGQEFELDYGSNGKLRFQVVGLLANSVLQGSLLISEANLVRRFPEVSGYRFFLVDTPTGRQPKCAVSWKTSFGIRGCRPPKRGGCSPTCWRCKTRICRPSRVWGGWGCCWGPLAWWPFNCETYLSDALNWPCCAATGFSRNRLGRLVLLEHLTLLLGGLGIGLTAALVAVIPHAWTTEVRPPWGTLAWVLMTILLVGIVSGYLALRPVIRASLMNALRSE